MAGRPAGLVHHPRRAVLRVPGERSRVPGQVPLRLGGRAHRLPLQRRALLRGRGARGGGGSRPDAFEARYLADGAPSRLEHFIGKDILRFHAVFWPAMLWAAGLKRPGPDAGARPPHRERREDVEVARHLHHRRAPTSSPGSIRELLRYFYAANLGPGVADLDLSLDEFRNRINADLANNVANLASRVAALVQKAGAPLQESPRRGWSRSRARRRWPAGARRTWPSSSARWSGSPTRWPIAATSGSRRRSPGRSRLRRGQPGAPVHRGQGAARHRHAALAGDAELRRRPGRRLRPGAPGAPGSRASTRSTVRPCPPPAKPPQIARLDAQAGAEARSPPRRRSPPAGLPGGQARPSRCEAPPQPCRRAWSPTTISPRWSSGSRLVRAAERVKGADKLLKLAVDAGEPGPRTIVAGIAACLPRPGRAGRQAHRGGGEPRAAGAPRHHLARACCWRPARRRTSSW